MLVTALQISESSDVLSNLSALERYASDAAAAGSVMVVTPELYLCSYNGCVVENTIKPSNIEELQRIARDAKIALVVGCARDAEGGGMHNSSIIIDSTGDILGWHDKAHLWSAGK